LFNGQPVMATVNVPAMTSLGKIVYNA